MPDFWAHPRKFLLAGGRSAKTRRNCPHTSARATESASRNDQRGPLYVPIRETPAPTCLEKDCRPTTGPGKNEIVRKPPAFFRAIREPPARDFRRRPASPGRRNRGNPTPINNYAIFRPLAAAPWNQKASGKRSHVFARYYPATPSGEMVGGATILRPAQWRASKLLSSGPTFVFRNLEVGSRTSTPILRNSGVGSRNSTSASWKLGVGIQLPEIGSCMSPPSFQLPEIGVQLLAAGSWKLEVRCKELNPNFQLAWARGGIRPPGDGGFVS